MNGPLRSVFTDCNSVLLTLDIQDEKGKQKNLGKSCETSFTFGPLCMSTQTAIIVTFVMTQHFENIAQKSGDFRGQVKDKEKG